MGLKPSRGWVPVGPHHDELAGGLDCEHVLARTVRDSALMLDLTSDSEPASRYAVARRSGLLAATSLPAVPLRIGIALRAPGGIAPMQEIGAAVEQAAAALSRAGHAVSEFKYPGSANVGEPAALIWMTATAEEVDFHRPHVGRDPQPDELEALTWACVALGRRSTAVDYVRARRALTAATRDMAEAFKGIDVLLLPTTADVAVRTGQIDGPNGGIHSRSLEPGFLRLRSLHGNIQRDRAARHFLCRSPCRAAGCPSACNSRHPWERMRAC